MEKNRRVVPGAAERDRVPGMVENRVSHADEHVFLDVGIELAVHLLQHVGRRRITGRLAAQHAPADRHDDRRRHAFAGNVRDRDAEPGVVHLEVIEVIAADMARGNIDAADFKSRDDRRFARQQDALDVARDLEIVIEPFFFIRF